MCMIELMEDEGLIEHDEIREGIQSKRDKLRIWSDLIEKPKPWQEVLAEE